ncbi:MAG: tetratricopeptide repeat protein, partial [Isosphaeraceae bacterium]
MKRQLNGRFLLVLLISTSVLGGGIVLLHSFQVGRSTKVLLEQADRAEEQGDPVRTEDYLSRYLHYQPGDVEALTRYARLREQHAQTPAEQAQVVQLYEKLLRLAPENKDARRRLVDLVMGLSDYTTAKRHLVELVSDDPANGELNDLLGRCEEAGGHAREARTRYETAREHDPTRLDAHVRLANLLREKLNDKAEADRVMIAGKHGDDLIATLLKHKVAGKDLAAAYMARARYRERWKLGESKDDVALALEQAPDDAEVLLAAAAVAQGSGDLPKAAGFLKRGVKQYPRRSEFHETLARLELQAGRPDEAVAALRQGLKAVGDDPAAISLQWTLADTLISMDQLKEASKIIDALKAKGNVRPELLGILNGRIQLGRKQWAAAVKTLETAATALAAQTETKGLAKRARLMIAQCHEQLGDPDQRYVAARQAAALTVDDDALQVAGQRELAAALTALNRLDEALEQYRLILPRDPRAGLNIAQIEIVRTLKRPESQRNWTAVDQIMTDLEQATPDSADLAILRAETLVARKDLKAARTQLRTALERHPDQINLWTALANLTEREQDGQAALKVLDDAGKRLGDHLELRLARSNFWARQGGPDAPSALAALEKDVEAFTDEQRDRLWRELGAAYSRVGKADDAQRLWSELANRRPGDLNIRILLFNLAMTRADAAGASRMLDQVRGIEGENGVFWRFGRSRLLIERVRKDPKDHAALTEARTLLAKAAEQRPTWAWVPLALADLADLTGHDEAAIQSYTRAVLDLGDRTPSALKRLLELLHQHKRHEQALALVQQLRKEGPISTGLQNLAADLAYQTRDYGQALELARQSIPEDSDNYLDQLRLGQYHWQAGKPAEPYFRRALALNQTDPAPRVALIAYLAVAKRTKDVDKELAEADRALPAESAPLGLAQCYQAAGRLDRAGELFEKARERAPKDVPTLRAVAVFQLQSNEPAKAQSLMNDIIRLGGDSDDAD